MDDLTEKLKAITGTYKSFGEEYCKVYDDDWPKIINLIRAKYVEEAYLEGWGDRDAYVLTDRCYLQMDALVTSWNASNTKKSIEDES